jgi:signal transduction histidine kinase
MNLRSVTAKFLIWSLSTLVLSLVAFSWISSYVAGSALKEAFQRIDEFQLHQAINAYEHGGREVLARYLAEMREFEESESFLIDASGKDLLTGQDRSDILRDSGRLRRSQSYVGDKIVVVVASPDWRYRFVIVVSPPYTLATFAPYYFILLAVVGVLFWLIAMHFAWPLRRLAAAVRRFGAGDLTARVGVNRRDEIGELGRSFDNMAARIQTLLTAERQLLQDVSHELRSPLARLTLAAELVGNSGDRAAAVSRLRRETDRLSELVNSLLQMTTAEGDPEALRVENVCLSDILREVARDCQLEAEERGCRVEVDAPDDVRVLGDADLLQRAIENVVRNAIRYSPAGAPIETRIVADGLRTTLSVRDHGPGIAEELLPKIFNPFFRADESRNSSSGGIGLGLAIAQRAVHLHNGEIRAANASPGLLVSIVLQRAE